MANEHGSLSINSENIFPVIKKWLYSDHDIFFRELISNGCDAITKLKKLDIMGEYTPPEDIEYKLLVKVNAEDKTIKFIDNGIGMTSDEVNEYINQIAFSGAEAFLEKYKDKTNEDQIIGHFGLGFYSAFMVSEKVEVLTRSWQENAQAVKWTCDGTPEFTIDKTEKDDDQMEPRGGWQLDELVEVTILKVRSSTEKRIDQAETDNNRWILCGCSGHCGAGGKDTNQS